MALNPTKFRAASKAAEGWLNTAALVGHFGPSGSVGPLFDLLLPPSEGGRGSNLQDSYREHAGVLDQAREALARVSDGPVTWEHGRGLSGMVRHPAAVYPHHWSSAHEAAVGIAQLVLESLVWPLAGI